MGGNVEDILRANGIERELTDEELAHAGVKGMRWGKRKKLSTERKQGNAERAAARAKTKTMTNEELKQAIDRLKLEKEYKQLNAHEISGGQKLVMEILRDVGKQTAKSYVTGAIQELTKKDSGTNDSKVIKEALKSAVKPQRQVMQLSKRPGF
jgi:hypothetical protein